MSFVGRSATTRESKVSDEHQRPIFGHVGDRGDQDVFNPFGEDELRLIRTRLVEGDPASPWSLGWFARTDEAGRARLSMSGASVGIQAGLYVYPEHDLVLAVLVNAWGRGAAGGEIVIDAPIRLVEDYLAGLHGRP